VSLSEVTLAGWWDDLERAGRTVGSGAGRGLPKCARARMRPGYNYKTPPSAPTYPPCEVHDNWRHSSTVEEKRPWCRDAHAKTGYKCPNWKTVPFSTRSA
jgi:hypothetical protein